MLKSDVNTTVTFFLKRKETFMFLNHVCIIHKLQAYMEEWNGTSFFFFNYILRNMYRSLCLKTKCVKHLLQSKFQEIETDLHILEYYAMSTTKSRRNFVEL